MAGAIAAKFFRAVLGQPQVKTLLSDEHFSVNGMLIEAWASMKSFKPKDSGDDEPPASGGGGRNVKRDFHGEKRTNATHASTIDPDARLFRRGRGKEAKLWHMGHLLMKNRSGLIIDAVLTPVTGSAERVAALTMIGRQAGRHRATLGADKGYDVADLVADLRDLNITPHVDQNTKRRSAVDRCTTRHPGYAASQACASGSTRASAGSTPRAACARPGIAAALGSAGMFALTAAACNLVRSPKLLAASP